MNYKLLIIGIFVAALSIIGASLAIGISMRDVEVEDNAYEAGLHFDQACKQQAALGWRVDLPREIKSGNPAIPIDVLDRRGGPIRDAEVVLELSRRGGHDVQAYRCTGDGRYWADVSVTASGYWDARIRVTRQNDSLRFEDTIYVQ